MSKIKRYGEEIFGEDGFQEYLDKEMEKNNAGKKHK